MDKKEETKMKNTEPEKTSRELAFEIINRIHSHGGYANILLPKILSLSKFDRRDRAFITELVYGTIRNKGTLDWIIKQNSSRKLNQINSKILDMVRLGCYQLVFTDKIPPHAACNEGVKMAKKCFSESAAKFVNAVLRNIAQEKNKIIWPNFGDDPIGYISLKHSHPRWLVRMWIDEIGMEETIKLCEANNQRPKMTIRVNTLKISREELAESLKKYDTEISFSNLVPDALILSGNRYVFNTPEFNGGYFTAQDVSSILVGYVLDPKPGETVLDACAAPGGKTTHMAQLMKNEGKIVAADCNPQRLKLVKETCKRLGVKNITFVESDVKNLANFVQGPFDRVLLDAPCSGLGVMLRRPDLRWKKSYGQLKGLAELQLSLLRGIAPLVKFGGVLVYSVCTISQQESKDVVEKFLKEFPEFKLDSCPNIPSELKSKEKWIQLLPHKHDTDGMFMARFKCLK